jgi:hypothetical protein
MNQDSRAQRGNNRSLSDSVIAFNNEVKSSLHLSLDETPKTAEEIYSDIADIVNGGDCWMPSVPTIYDYLRLFERLGIVCSDEEEDLEKEDRGAYHRVEVAQRTRFWLVDDSLKLPAFFSLEYAVGSGESLFNFFGKRNVEHNGHSRTRLDIMLAFEEKATQRPSEISRAVGKPDILVVGNLQALRGKGYLRRIGAKNEIERFRVARDLPEELLKLCLPRSCRGLYDIHQSSFIQGVKVRDIVAELRKRGYNIKKSMIGERLLEAAKDGFIDRVPDGQDYIYTAGEKFNKYFEKFLGNVPGYAAMANLARTKLTPKGEMRTFTRKELAGELGSMTTAMRYIRKLTGAGALRPVKIGFQRTKKGKDITGYALSLAAHFNGEDSLRSSSLRLESISRPELGRMLATAFRNYADVSPPLNCTPLQMNQQRVIGYLRRNGTVPRAELVKQVGTGDFDNVLTTLSKRGAITSERRGLQAFYSIA